MLTDRECAEILEWMLEKSDDDCLARGHQGSVHLFEGDRGTYVVKAPGGKGFGLTVRSWMIRNEHRAYQRLQGLEGFPTCHGLVDNRYLVLSYVDADTLETHKLEDTELFYSRLMELIEQMHGAGVAHGDLRRRSNVLVAEGERPVIVDLGASIRLKKRSSWLRRRAFKLLMQDDRHSWVKLKYRRHRLAAPHDRQLESPYLVKRIRKAIRKVRTMRAAKPERSPKT